MNRVESDAWKKTQVKTFTKWFNAKLESGERALPTDLKEGLSFAKVVDLFADLRDGTGLVSLMASITGRLLPHTKAPRSRFQRLENIEQVLKYIVENKVPLTNIGAPDIEGGNEKLVLGLVWIIILRFAIADGSNGDTGARSALLHWCRNRTRGYADVDVKDFSASWQNGLAFTALIHSGRPELVGDYDALKHKPPGALLQDAFDLAEKEFGIPKLLDVEDMVDVLRPDEKSVMTYVSQFQKYFTEQEEQVRQKREKEEFLRAVRWTVEARATYDSLQSRSAQLSADIAVLEEEFNKAKQSLDRIYKGIKEAEKERFSTALEIEALSDELAFRTSLLGENSELPAVQLPPFHPIGLFNSSSVIDSIWRWGLCPKLEHAGSQAGERECSFDGLLGLYYDISASPDLLQKIAHLEELLCLAKMCENGLSSGSLEGLGTQEKKLEYLEKKSTDEQSKAVLIKAIEKRVYEIKKNFHAEIEEEREVEEKITSILGRKGEDEAIREKDACLVLEAFQIAREEAISVEGSCSLVLLKEHVLRRIRERRRVCNIELSFKLVSGGERDTMFKSIESDGTKAQPLGGSP